MTERAPASDARLCAVTGTVAQISSEMLTGCFQREDASRTFPRFFHLLKKWAIPVSPEIRPIRQVSF